MFDQVILFVANTSLDVYYPSDCTFNIRYNVTDTCTQDSSVSTAVYKHGNKMPETKGAALDS